MVTLVTCYPYGVNTHRLLVKAERCDYIEYEDDNSILETISTTDISSNLWLYILGAVVLIIILITIICIIVQKVRKKNK